MHFILAAGVTSAADLKALPCITAIKQWRNTFWNLKLYFLSGCAGSVEGKKTRSHKFLCLRVGKPMKKTFVSNASASMQQYAQQGKKHEYWFSVPQERSVPPLHINAYRTPTNWISLGAAAFSHATGFAEAGPKVALFLTHHNSWLNYRALHLQSFEYLKPIKYAFFVRPRLPWWLLCICHCCLRQTAK